MDGPARRRLADAYDARAPGNVVQAARTRARRRRLAAARRWRSASAPTRSPPRRERRARRSPPASSRGAPRYAAGWAALPRVAQARPGGGRPGRSTPTRPSLLVLAAHEDKRNPGAVIASPTMPWVWGKLTHRRRRTRAPAPYHLVWPRDLYQVATAEIAAGDGEPRRRARSTSCSTSSRRADGSFPQNTQVDGRRSGRASSWTRSALPIVLAWQLGRTTPTTWRARRSGRRLHRRHGPGTEQERWENQSGYSPGTIAAEIAGLVCAADIARRNGDDGATPSATSAMADRWRAPSSAGRRRPNGPYSRRAVLPAPDQGPPPGPRHDATASATAARRTLDQREVVDPSFLELVRLGVKRARRPGDPQHARGRRRAAARQTPNGPFWHRFTYDGYGERCDGAAVAAVDGRTRA